MAEWLGVGIAVVAAVISIFAAFQARISQREAQRLGERTWATNYISEIRQWAGRACDAVSEAHSLCRAVESDGGGTDWNDRVHAVRTRLSSLIDQGRWFFPNETVNGRGTHKQTAFQGYRDKTLDPLVAVYNTLGRVQKNQEESSHASKRVVEHKREFVSEIHTVVSKISGLKTIDVFLTKQ